jgi:hypothetical protein
MIACAARSPSYRDRARIIGNEAGGISPVVTIRAVSFTLQYFDL